MRRSHLSIMLTLAVLGMAEFGSTSWAAQPEILGQPKELVAQAPKKGADPADNEGKDAPKKADAKEEAKADEKKDSPKTEDKTEEPAAMEAAKPNPWDKSVEDLTKGVTDAKQRGDTAWMLISSALVLLMVPGLALFYGGMVRKKNVLATMMQSYAAMSIVGLYWIAVGYGLAFGPSILKVDMFGVKDGGIVGWSNDLFFLKNIKTDMFLPAYNIPVYCHVMFQGMFAIITPALISGALAERIRFWPFCIFMILWVTFVYCPLAHMVWAWDWFYKVPVDDLLGIGGSAVGLLGKMGALDFAGGTVVHIAAGTAGLACALVLRKRLGYPEHTIQPNSMVLTLIGAGLLWVGWFGFNGGSSVMSNPLAVSAFAATQAAAAAAGLSWILVEWLLKGKPTALGLASGIVAGLVAVTPASGYVFMWGGVIIGLIAGVVCYFAVQLKSMFGYDDSLDAFGVHAVGGFLGAVLTGFFCYLAVNSAGGDGYFAVKTNNSRMTELREKFPDAPALAEIKGLEEQVAKLEADVKKAQEDKKADDEKKATEELTAVKADLDKATAALKKSAATKKIDEIKEAMSKTEAAVAKAKEEAAAATAAIDPLADAARKAEEKGGADAKKAKDAYDKAAAEQTKKTDDYQALAAEYNKLKADEADLNADMTELADRETKATLLWKKERGPMTQVVIQFKAALFALVFAFVLSLILAIAVQAMTLGNFTTDNKSESEGLDLTEHGEIGFDLNVGYDSILTNGSAVPKAAKVPPGQKRFEVVLEGIDNGELMKAWSVLCQPSDQPIDPDFKEIYPYVTTVQGNRFRLRGGDQSKLSASIQKLFSKRLGKPLKVRVEE